MAEIKNAETQDAEKEKHAKELWQRRKYAMEITRPFEEFKEWYDKQPQKCCYCGITEQQIAELDQADLLENKRAEKRGRHLELERKEPDKCYDDFDNLALACYWCNNAKTDTFTAAEFQKAGQAFAEIWQERLQNNRKKGEPQ